MEQQKPFLRILHFNDGEIAQQTECSIGAARFKTAIEQYRTPNTLLLCSGDFLMVSSLSAYFDGEQIIKPYKYLNIDYQCFGNHEFDLSSLQCQKLIQQTQIKFVHSNLKSKDINMPEFVYGAKEYEIVLKNGIKIGIFGLGEEEWLSKIKNNILETYDYEDYLVCAKRMIKILREQEECDLVIVLSHMSIWNQRILAKSVPELDVILSGHSHEKYIQIEQNNFIIENGGNFQYFAVIDVENTNKINSQIKQDIIFLKNGLTYQIKQVQVDNSFNEDQLMKQYIDEYLIQYQQELDVNIFITNIVVDCDQVTQRLQETELGNFICDCIKFYMKCDVVLLQSGELRLGDNSFIKQGAVKLETVRSILAFADIIVIKQLTGKQILQCLENSVDAIPIPKGQFMQVSGIHFSYKSTKQTYQKVDQKSVFINNQQIDLEQIYIVAMTKFVSQGRDGYDFLKNSPNIDQLQPITDYEIIKQLLIGCVKDSELKQDLIHCGIIEDTELFDGQEIPIVKFQLNNRIIKIE